MSNLEFVIYFLGSVAFILIVASAFLFCVLCLLKGFYWLRRQLSEFVFWQRFFNVIELPYTLYFIRRSDQNKLVRMKEMMESTFENYANTWEYKLVYGVINKKIG